MEESMLNDEQIDALREIGNIGIGNAATAMSQLLRKRIEISVPKVNVVEFDELFNITEDEVVYAVIARVLGDVPGNMLFVFEKEAMFNIVETLVGEEKGDELSELGFSVLGEMGNIIFTTYMNAIAKLTGLSLFPSVPAVTRDMLTAILSTTFIEAGQYSDKVLDIETEFMQESKELKGNFYYVPMPGSLEKILQSLGLN